MTRQVVGWALLATCIAVFVFDLYHFAQIGTCASGPTPYMIARQCPSTIAVFSYALPLNALTWSLTVSLFLVFTAGSLIGTLNGWLSLWCGIFIGGACALLLALLNGTISDYGGAKVAAITVIVTFMLLGVPPLFFIRGSRA